MNTPHPGITGHQCPPGEHHLYAQVNVRARVVLSPEEQTFEFFGDWEPNLRIFDLECVECSLHIPAGTPMPADIRGAITEALESASIMEPLD